MLGEDQTIEGPDTPLAPEDVIARDFPTSFRGYDQAAVREFLAEVAGVLRDAEQRTEERVAALEQAVQAARAAEHQAEARAEEAGVAARAASEGTAANENAAPLATDAPHQAAKRAERLLAEAREEADRIRQEADAVLAARTEDAEAEFDRIRAKADTAAAAIRVRARQESDAILEAARERGREMVGEAQAARERMLADLAKRKRAAQAQMEQMRIGRDRLVENMRLARRTIDELALRFEGPEGRVRDEGRPDPSVPEPEVTTRAATMPPGLPPPAPELVPRADAGLATRRPASSTDDHPSESTPAGGMRLRFDPPDLPAGASAAVGAPAEERRSSSLRILRRSRPTPAAPPAVDPVEPPSSAEGVRVIRPAAREQSPGSASSEPVPATATSEPVDAGPTAPPPEPLRAVDPQSSHREGVIEPVRAAEAAPAPTSADPVAEVAAPSPSPARPARPSEVEQLFARIRADQETVVIQRAVPADQASARTDDAETEEGSVGGSAPVGSRNGATADLARSDSDESLLQRRDRAVEPLQAQLVRKLKRSLQDDQNAALDRLRTNRRAPDADAVLPPPAEQHERYRSIAAVYLAEAAKAGAATGPIVTSAVPVDDLAAQLAYELTVPLRARLQRVVGESRTEDADLAGVGERISGVYREWKARPTEQLAGHFVVAAYARGAFEATADGTLSRWLVDDDRRCPDCDDNALAGPTPRGEPFPTGQVHPPAHVGCRCLLAPPPT